MSLNQKTNESACSEPFPPAAATQKSCYVNIATSPKHPFWCLLGNAVEPSQSRHFESYAIEVAHPLETQLINLLDNCCRARLAVYVKFEDSKQPTFRNLFVDVNHGEHGALDVLLYR